MKKEIKFIYIRESLIESVLMDTFSTLVLLFSMWFNYRFLDNSKIFAAFLLFLFLIQTFAMVKRMWMTPEEAKKELNKK